MKKAAADIFKYGLVLFLGIFIGTLSYSGRDVGNYSFLSGFKSDEKLSKVIQLIRKNYVDSVNLDSLQNRSINELLQSLDPHSIYLPPVQASASKEKLEGSFEGIGMEYHLLRDTLYVTYVFPGGPSSKAGIKPGDRILKVDQENLSGTGLSTQSVVARLKGKKGSKVALEIQRWGSNKLLNFDLERGQVALSSVEVAYLPSPGVGYIKVGKFAATTSTDFKQALNSLKAKGMQKLVLDLRGNGGGYLNAATSMADEFLPGGKLIMYTQGSHEPRTEYFSTDSGTFENGNLAVLIDEYSASASEIMAGAIQDLDRGIIVGRRSFGKGLVQEQFPFQDGSAINLTVARYYTPSGRSIQKSYSMGLDHYHNELLERNPQKEMLSAENHLQDTSRLNEHRFFTTSGRIVASGGGITPDIFVPTDTVKNTWLLAELSAHRVFMDFLIDKLLPDLSKYARYDDFNMNFKLSDAKFDELLMYASGRLENIDADQMRSSKPYIASVLKSLAARFKFGAEAYYKTLNQDDTALLKALESVN